jgi:hypothetical protein
VSIALKITADTSPLRKALQEMAARLPGSIQQALASTGAAAEASVRGSTRFKDKTGTLRATTKTSVSSTPFLRVLASPPKYARFVAWGNAPGGVPGARIYPRRAKFLRFVLNGQVVYRRSVRSHGPLPYMTDARDVIVATLPGAMVSYVTRALRGG